MPPATRKGQPVADSAADPRIEVRDGARIGLRRYDNAHAIVSPIGQAPRHSTASLRELARMGVRLDCRLALVADGDVDESGTASRPSA